MSSRAWDGLKPPLARWIIEAISAMGFRRMTPVQASTIPLFSSTKDVVVEAVTGSGKTLAYLIPVVERLLRLEEPLKKHHVGAIIISPTRSAAPKKRKPFADGYRELATQIHQVLQNLLAFHGPSNAAAKALDDDSTGEAVDSATTYPPGTLHIVSQLLVGGNTTPARDLEAFLKNSPNLLVSTPGRLLELLSSSRVHCPQSSFEVLVLDEADRLLDLGFKEDLQKIIGKLPKQRRTGLFSASMSEAVDQIVRIGLRNPVKISVKVKGGNGLDRRTPTSLQMSYVVAKASHKLPVLNKLLSTLETYPQKSIIYLSTCAAVDYFQNIMPAILPARNGHTFTLIPLHGKQPSAVRQKNFRKYIDSTTPCILLTTDVAARGLDIPQIDLVLQIDPPSDPKVFLHRCGRAGRAGRKGLSIIFLLPGREEDYIAFLAVRQTPITPLTTPCSTATDAEAAILTQQLRKSVLLDRALHDKAQRAFVSWLKAYSKHQASSIFRVADIDWADTGAAWGLLRLPRMPELKAWDGDRSLGIETDFSTFEYKDRQKEEARKRDLEEYLKGGSPSKARAPKALKSAWSQQLDEKAQREARRGKKHVRRERQRWEGMTPLEREKQRELEAMIDKVKQIAQAEAEPEFEGFGD